MTDRLERYLKASAAGSAEAAYEAAKLLQAEGRSASLVQTQLQRAACGGYIPAQRELGKLGLSDALVEEGLNEEWGDASPEEQGARWLERAYLAGDPQAGVYYATVCMTGCSGLPVDPERANRIMEECWPLVSEPCRKAVSLVLLMMDLVSTAEDKRSYLAGVISCGWERGA